MFQTEIVEKIKTHMMFNNFPPPSKNGAICEIMWKNIVELDTSQNTAHVHCM